MPESDVTNAEYYEELEVRVNRSLLFDIAHDGILVDEAKAAAGPCECFTLPSGKLYCWDKGIVGALDQAQISLFCPPEKRVPPKSGGKLPERIEKFVEASQACEIGKPGVVDLQTRIACMSREASARGIKI